MSNLASGLYPWAVARERRFAANIVTNPKHISTMSWSWQNIQAVYQILGRQLNEYKEIADRFEMDLPLKPRPGEIIQYADGSTDFIHHFYAGVSRINEHLRALDQEIARRNKLIGVMG